MFIITAKILGFIFKVKVDLNIDLYVLQYSVSVLEMETKEILRMKVTDADEPNTPASRPVFKILRGNEEGNYMIETDPVTQEGVLRVVKVGQTTHI